jgi:hypothetical protein
MGRGPADEAVVAVKVGADEDAVTYPRVKLPSSGPAESRTGGEGWNMCPRFDVPLETIVWRSALKGAASLLKRITRRCGTEGIVDQAMQREVK